MAAYVAGIIKPPKTFTLDEQRKLLAETGQYKDTYRDHIIISLALGTALREHEIGALNVGDIYTQDGAPKRRVVLRVFKKSSEDASMQEVFLPDTLRAKLSRFYVWKQQHNESVLSDAPLLISKKKGRISLRQIRRLFAKWQEKAGLDRKLNFHQARHTACTNLYNLKKDILLVKRFARHKDISSTIIYTHTSDEELLQNVQQLVC